VKDPGIAYPIHCKKIPVLFGSTTGRGGGFIEMIPTPAPSTPSQPSQPTTPTLTSAAQSGTAEKTGLCLPLTPQPSTPAANTGGGEGTDTSIILQL